MKILIFGLPGSGKTTLAEPFAKLVGGIHINADAVRKRYEGNDMSKWDFSLEGRIKQAQRMKHLADGVVMTGKIAVADFVCPTEQAREEFGPDFTVWMDTIDEGRYDDTNKMFEDPPRCDYHVSKWFDDTHTQLVPVIERYMMKKDLTPVAYECWRREREEEL